MATLLTGTDGVENRHPVHLSVEQSLLHFGKLSRLDHTRNEFHLLDLSLLGIEDLQATVGLHAVLADVESTDLVFLRNTQARESLERAEEDQAGAERLGATYPVCAHTTDRIVDVQHTIDEAEALEPATTVVEQE